ncbi:hypothetical protein TCE0_015r02424 [Talaromyces pinophilus]|jgi:hypothetical protein|uniref:Uncharacterized protein n=1 Tax=Talaromyces pinophilus TaxID=128442 RepID=A0A6V8H041_TALPI|nr:hypothetical protein DPV78_005611 [Talaromyces pinophilus]PCG93924.1 hypothetical protein PENOC_085250 [Penicillium occitanis (nom. inval.)]PCG97904.1 Hypothetical protein PENO1_060680 [Penicillium occitanis (nom. inval.)]GAM34688.1 hypothetical protein TCE0_015r02424 [Talaromyces pinophilus]
MQFFTSLTTLFLATMAFGAVIDTRNDGGDALNVDKEVESATCSPKGGACIEGSLGCCEGLRCYIPPKSGWEPQGAWTLQGACI